MKKGTRKDSMDYIYENDKPDSFEMQYKTECDARALIKAAEVSADKDRLKAAKKEVKSMTLKKEEELKAMKDIK